LGSTVPRLSLTGVEESEEWITVVPKRRTTAGKGNSMTDGRQSPPVTRSHSNNSQAKTILCVDWDNTGKLQALAACTATDAVVDAALSKITQIYFELLRLWSLDTTSFCPFDRVESASNHLTPETDIDCEDAMDLIARPGSSFRRNFRSRDYPDEKGRLMSRMRASNPAIFTEKTLQKFDCVICLGDESFKRVREANKKQQAGPDRDRQIHKWSSVSLDVMVGKRLNPKSTEAEKAVAYLKHMVGKLMGEKPEWKWPHCRIVEGQKRTLQLSVPKQAVGHIIGKRGANIIDMEKKSNCAIRIFEQGVEGNLSLLLATGQGDGLKWVEEKIEATVSRVTTRLPRTGTGGHICVG
jgi:hypothetical protein